LGVLLPHAAEKRFPLTGCAAVASRCRRTWAGQGVAGRADASSAGLLRSPQPGGRMSARRHPTRARGGAALRRRSAAQPL